MVALWGPIPYTTEPVKAPVSTTPTRVPEAVVYKNILTDIDSALVHFKAANFMNKAKNGGLEARATYYAAQALKARVALYAASWLGNNSIDGYANLYQIAQTAAEDVIANSGASFYDRYADTWNLNNEAVQDNKEAIWGVYYNNDLTKENCIPYRYKTDDNGNHLSFNSLITRTGYSRGGSAMNLMFVPMWNNGNTGDVGSNGVNIGGWKSFPGIKKFLDDQYNSNYPTHDITYRDAIVFRLSEMYLIKAECQLQTGGDALATLNHLRSARAIEGQNNSLSGTVDINTILDERALELCGEQQRWFA